MEAPSRRDVSLAVLLTAVGGAELYTSWAFERTPLSGPTVGHLIVPVLIGAALVWRRRYPLLVPPIVTAILAYQANAMVWPNTYTQIVVQILAVFSLVAHTPTVRAAVLPALAVLALGATFGAADKADPIGSVVTFLILDGGVMVAGAVVRRQRQRADSMARERDLAEQRTREIAASERARIARELHDVVAHGMSVVVLQARGGRRMLEADPATARRAFDDIERVASDCLDEMRRMLGMLRDPGSEGALLTPQPRLHELEYLVEQARASGAQIDLVIDGDRRDLAPALELSVFRIAQEALTNALKHAPGSTTRLRVTYESDAVAIVVTDNGPGGQLNGQGHGLIGMRERVDLFGGTFHAGVEPSGGFGVRARLPLAVEAR